MGLGLFVFQCQFSEEKFLYAEDAPEVVGYLSSLQEERAKQAQKESDAPEKHSSWVNMHMSLADKRLSVAKLILHVILYLQNVMVTSFSSLTRHDLIHLNPKSNLS